MKHIFNLIIIIFIAILSIFFCPIESVSSNKTILFNETIPFNGTISFNGAIPFNETKPFNRTNETISSVPRPSGICLKSKIVGNGTQIKTGGNPDGWCSSLIQGQIPTNQFMISTLIIKPKDGSDDEYEEIVPNPSIFAFFRGLNDPANDQGILETEVGSDLVPGLPSGKYRVCTMVSTFAHQPVIMPVAQRGSQDDCIRFTVKN